MVNNRRNYIPLKETSVSIDFSEEKTNSIQTRLLTHVQKLNVCVIINRTEVLRLQSFTVDFGSIN